MAEQGCLLSSCAGNGTESSNLSLSATSMRVTAWVAPSRPIPGLPRITPKTPCLLAGGIHIIFTDPERYTLAEKAKRGESGGFFRTPIQVFGEEKTGAFVLCRRPSPWRTPGTAHDDKEAAMKTRGCYCNGQRLSSVVMALSSLALGSFWKRRPPGQPAHIAELTDTGLSESLELLHADKDARGCPESQGNAAEDLGRSETGIRRDRSGQTALDQLAQGLPDSIASSPRKPAAWWVLRGRTACWRRHREFEPLPLRHFMRESGSSE